MPNHVRNILSFDCSPEKLSEILIAVHGDAVGEDAPSPFDFNKIVPMPACLFIESGSVGDQGLAIVMHRMGKSDRLQQYMNYPWVKSEASVNTLDDLAAFLEKRNPECIGLGEKYFANIQEFGHTTWHGWSNEFWGTKWNAYDIVIEDGQICFDTAWSTPVPIIQKLSKMFPDVPIHHLYADEDTGHNCGIIDWKNGQAVESGPEEGTSEARKFAISVRLGYSDPSEVSEDDLRDWGMDADGNYEEDE